MAQVDEAAVAQLRTVLHQTLNPDAEARRAAERHLAEARAAKAEFDATVALAQKKLGRNIKKRYGNGSANVRRLLEVFGD